LDGEGPKLGDCGKAALTAATGSYCRDRTFT
jgi:hypothetical protein